MTSDQAYAIAHRGCSMHHPENTLAAFTAAVGHASVLELDVRATSDCVLICTHDRTLQRCYDVDQHVGQLSWDELHEIAPDIPRLHDVLAAHAHDVGWIIDCKVTRPRAIAELERVVADIGISWDSGDALRSGEPIAAGTAAFESSDSKVLQAFHSRNDAGVLELVGGATTAAQLALTAPLITTYAHGVTLPDRLATPRMLTILRVLRLGSYVYTINEQDRFDQLVHDGASGIFTDDVVHIH